ncbi:MAG TPA: energy transducer TonB [Gallionellaceae bacterium]
MNTVWIKQRWAQAMAFSPLSLTLPLSVALHVFVLFGIGFVLPAPITTPSFLQPLEVVLVNSQSRSRPLQADALAQRNLDGGGNIAADKRASTPLPTLSDDKQLVLEQSSKSVKQLEQEVHRLLTQLKSTHSVEQEKTPKKTDTNSLSGQDLVQRSLEIARLEAQISKEFNAYQKLPKRTFVGARTQEYRYAQYVEDWRVKVERIGNLNYPAQARQQKIFGQLRMTVSIRADGSVESVEINKSSGHRILDAAAMRIVRLAAPYAPFPPDMRKDTDILSIVRTWSFTSTEHLESE